MEALPDVLIVALGASALVFFRGYRNSGKPEMQVRTVMVRTTVRRITNVRRFDSKKGFSNTALPSFRFPPRVWLFLYNRRARLSVGKTYLE